MIGSLSGQITYIFKESLILDVKGVGYQITLSSADNYHINDRFKFWIHTHVKEDQLQLFGFLDLNEKNFFLSLIKISGIGPKVAMNILSASTVQQLITYIENKDSKALSQLPKIGQKKAEQIILSLKGKWPLKKSSKKDQGSQTLQAEVLSALMHLGFKKAAIEKSFENLEQWTDFQTTVKICLNYLTK